LLTNYADFRRYFRPFFLDPKTSKPTSYKIFYDIFSFIITQLAFSFTTVPFVILTLPESFLVWSRVYFYIVIATALATAFFASPAKQFMAKKVNMRAGVSGSKLQRTHSQESIAGREPVLGLPPDPSKDLEEIMSEARAELEDRQRRNSVNKPNISSHSKKEL
jgi:lysophospholipid acyltransferase